MRAKVVRAVGRVCVCCVGIADWMGVVSGRGLSVPSSYNE